MEDILRQLVAFPSVSTDRQANHECIEYIASFLAERGLFVERFEFNGIESLVATTKQGTKNPKVMLAAHCDVVPAEPPEFELRAETGRYYGRGVVDMKFAIAAYMQLADDLKDNLGNYDFGIMITSDEEVGGRDGTAMLVDAGYIPEVCILPDGGDNWHIQTSSKGFLAFEISAEGKPAHGSRPWQGDNAITKLLGILDEIAALFPKVPSGDTNTISLTRFNGDEAMNQVPAQAKMSIDVRTISSAEHARLYEAISTICHHNQASYSHISDAAPTNTDLNHPLVAPFAKLVTKYTSVEQHGYHALGASDIRFYVPYGVPCISVYPTGGNLHAADEWIDAQALQDFKTILNDYMRVVAAD
jgi:succinyl-diaminopimelate desuccinylase